MHRNTLQTFQMHIDILLTRIQNQHILVNINISQNLGSRLTSEHKDSFDKMSFDFIETRENRLNCETEHDLLMIL